MLAPQLVPLFRSAGFEVFGFYGLLEVLDGADAQLDELEAFIGAKLPDEFRDFYKVHNGQDADVVGLIVAEEILSIDRIKEQWGIWKELYDQGTFTGKHSDPDDGIKDDWCNIRP